MIPDADRSIVRWLRRALPAGTAVRLGAPPAAWAADPPRAPTLSAFLVDIREDTGGLAGDVQHLRDANGQITGRQAPARRYRLRYLLTAWGHTDDNTDGAVPVEHELLAAVLAASVEHHVLPGDCLAGSLTQDSTVVPLRCAGAEQQPAAAELLDRLGLPPRTALDLVIVAPLAPTPVAGLVPPPTMVDVRIGAPTEGAATRPAGRRPVGRVTEQP